MKLKKFLLKVLLIFIAIFIFGITNVNAATEYEENLIYRIAADGKNSTFKTIKPKDKNEAYLILSNVVNNILDEEEYTADVHCTDDELTKCDITIYKRGVVEPIIKFCDINVTYDVPEENEVVNSILSKIKVANDESDFENFYFISDLNLINLYMTETDINRIWSQNAARHLKFSKDFIEISDGSDVSFYLETRCGGGGAMYLYAMGETSLFYNNYNYDNVCTGIYLQRVIYIPEKTKETPEAYIKAAQERIDSYLGAENEVKVTYGGTLNSLGEDDEDVVQREKTDGNYYNVTINDETYKFYIMKGSNKQLEKPKYKGKHIKTNIKITTDNSTVPLDTHLTVEVIKNKDIEEIVGTDNYYAYDIKLYSTTKSDSIKKINNGKFLVSIPLDGSFDGENVIVYYLDNNNKLNKYETIVKDGVASFETDHFSTYILAEKIVEKDTSSNITEDTTETMPKDTLDDTPKTGTTNLFQYVVIAVVILYTLGIVALSKKTE